MWQSQMQTLNQLLREETEFAKIANYFMDHFGMNPEFAGLGSPYSSQILSLVVAKLCEAYHPGQRVAAPRLIRVPEYRLIHGGFEVAGCVGLVFYSESINLGLATVSELPPSCLVHYGRFRDLPLGLDDDEDPPAAPSRIHAHPHPDPRPRPRPRWNPSMN